MRAAVVPIVIAIFLLNGPLPEAEALPDLTAEVFGISVAENQTVDPGDVVEGCAGAVTGRRLIHFSLRTRNLGPSDLTMGDPGCPNCSVNPGAPCSNPLYVCGAAHGHPHFEEFALAELRDSNNQVVVTGQKQGFCLLDLECANPQFSCGFQGISAGCSDVYAAGLPCQYIDITDANVPDGDYTLRVAVDFENAIPEASEGNNTATVNLHIGDPPPPPPPTCPVYGAIDLPKPILDLNTVTSSLTGPAAGTVQRVRVVDLSGTHTHVGDLEFHVRSPEGTDVNVLDHVCGGGDDFDLDLSDQATVQIGCPLTGGGLYLPSNPLAAFVGEQASGTWTLEVHDTAGQDVGQLDTWGLEICTECGNGTIDAGEVCDDGNSVGGDCCSANCQTAAANGTDCNESASCTVGGSCQSGLCTGGTVGCDPCLTCQEPLGCQPPPNVLCDSSPAARSSVTLRKGTAPSRDSLIWSWISSTPVALLDFGSPATATDLTLCVFDQTGLKLSATAPHGEMCGAQACWKQQPSQTVYFDKARTPDGVARLTLKPGDAGKARITARAGGDLLDLPPLGLAGNVTVRLKRSGGPACWEAKFPSALRNDATTYRAKLP